VRWCSSCILLCHAHFSFWGRKASKEVVETRYFVCEIIRPIKRRSSRTALNKNKSMNKVLSVHTCVEQCLYQFLRDGQCYNGQYLCSCKEFKQRIDGIDLEQIASGLRARLKDSIVLKYREQAERNKVTTSTDTEEVFTKKVLFPPMDEERKRTSSAGVVSYVWFDPKIDRVTKTKKVRVEKHGTGLNQVASGGGSANKKAPKSLCTKCGAWIQYPHDSKTLTVTCWLCVAKEVLAHENKKPETSDTKTKEGKSNGKRTSIPKRKKPGRRSSRA
jgi:hypothetical protein